MSEDKKPRNVAVIAHYHPLAIAALTASLMGGLLRPEPDMAARAALDDLLQGRGPLFEGNARPRPLAKRLLLGELNESNAPASKPRKFRHNRKG